ncbi:MAG: hypothetical protein IJ072_03040, partial [Oscillospiraceae bacterium]|nr:hypothetical protein [Oscillospiraceae bacterium]
LIVTGTSFSASGYPAADAFKDSFDMMPYGYDAYNIYSNFVYGVGFTVFGIVILIAAVVVLLINIFFYRKAHKVARSICVSAETGILSVEKSKGVRIWMLVMGILTAISALNSLATAGIINDFSESFFEELNLHIHYSPLPAVLASICTAAAHILGYVWMKKNLTQFNDEGAPVQYAPVNTYYDAPQQDYAQQPQDYVQQAPTAMDAKVQELNGFMHEAAQQFTTPVQEASAEPDITAQTPAIETTQQAVDAINEVKSQLEDEADDTPQDMVEDVLEDTFEDAQSDAQSTEDEYFTDNEDTEE